MSLDNHQRVEMEALLKRLRGSRETPEVQALLRYLHLRLEDHKERLVRCNNMEFQTLQGEARTLSKLIDDFVRPNLFSTKSKEA